ncbi:cell wall hydrolase [Cupriavidus campinensis]|uniref:Cell wall hydrolase n=1 Tax=Cupriavidus campinensis TaxID=151783 RepID=A0ABY3ETU8_9BURK|nr:cell wall hydrolase [Cupriavidus campinensis]TSP14003.1 cell wall hydrolase [Cupriavidus campinensis]
MALNIFHEARGEFIPGQYGVALVTMNRAHQRGKSVCDTVFEPKQFSWANRGVRKLDAGYKVARSLAPQEIDPDAWERSKAIATVVLRGQFYDLTDGATYYHERKVRPYWSKEFRKTKTLGRHVFYRQ